MVSLISIFKDMIFLNIHVMPMFLFLLGSRKQKVNDIRINFLVGFKFLRRRQ